MVTFNNCSIIWHYSFLLIAETLSVPSEQNTYVRKIGKKNWMGAMDCGGRLSHLCVFVSDRLSNFLSSCSLQLILSLSLGQVGWEDVIIADVSLTFPPPGDRRKTNSLYCSYIICNQYVLNLRLHVLPCNVPLTSCATVICHSWCPAKCDPGQCACSTTYKMDLA